MKCKCITFVFLALTLFSLSGCMTYESFTRVDELTKQILVLEKEAQEKIAEAEAGDLNIAEAIAWVRQASETIEKAKDEIRDIKKSDNIGWVEVIGAALVSMLGGGGLIRAWRGPSHKNALSGPTA